jgi:hypothetical protein
VHLPVNQRKNLDLEVGFERVHGSNCRCFAGPERMTGARSIDEPEVAFRQSSMPHPPISAR